MSYLTAHDVCQRLTLYLGGNAISAAQKEMKIAISNAYREIVEAYNWRSMRRVAIMNLTAPFTTGTVSYTHTGGAAERLWTFSSPIPSTVNGRWFIKINHDLWRIQRYLSPTTVQSDPTFNPGADVASTTFEMHQGSYLLPEDFISMSIGMPSSALISTYLGGADVTWLNRINGTSGTAYGFTIDRDLLLPQRLGLTFASWPATAQTYGFMYQRFGRKLKYFGFLSRERGGTCSISGTSVTGVNTAFESGMEGSIIRLSPDSRDYPTDEGGDNVYSFEGVIDQVISPTSLTVISNDTNSVISGAKYIISDPIDLAYTMLTAFQRCCEMQGEITRQREGSGKADVANLYADAIATAKAADRTTRIPESLVPTHVVTLSDLERNNPSRPDVL